MDRSFNTLILRVDPSLTDRLKAQAWHMGVPAAALVRSVLTAYLDASPTAAEALLDFIAADRPRDKRRRAAA